MKKGNDKIAYFNSTIEQFTCFCVFIHILTLLNYKYNKYSPNIKIPIIRDFALLMTQVSNYLFGRNPRVAIQPVDLGKTSAVFFLILYHDEDFS